MEIALLGDRFSAAEAKELGMINRVVPSSDIEEETRKLAERLAQGPTKAYGSIKRLILKSSESSLEEQLQSEAETFGVTAMAEDWVEGVSAFNQKRKARFTGR